FDFRMPHAIGLNAGAPGVGDQTPPGYDHNWVVRGKADQLRPVARVKDPVSGRVMSIKADQPGVQFYTINFPASVTPGREDEIIRPAQGETYSHQMVIKFSAE